MDYLQKVILGDGRYSGGALILSSIFKSQNVDYSYDVIDFKEIDPIFGNITDLQFLVSEAHKLGIKVILEFIPNHTSDQHDWFRRSTDGDREFKDFYVWHDGNPPINDGRASVPNNWVRRLKKCVKFDQFSYN